MCVSIQINKHPPIHPLTDTNSSIQLQAQTIRNVPENKSEGEVPPLSCAWSIRECIRAVPWIQLHILLNYTLAAYPNCYNTLYEKKKGRKWDREEWGQEWEIREQLPNTLRKKERWEKREKEREKGEKRERKGRGKAGQKRGKKMSSQRERERESENKKRERPWEITSLTRFCIFSISWEIMSCRGQFTHALFDCASQWKSCTFNPQLFSHFFFLISGVGFLSFSLYIIISGCCLRFLLLSFSPYLFSKSGISMISQGCNASSIPSSAHFSLFSSPQLSNFSALCAFLRINHVCFRDCLEQCRKVPLHHRSPWSQKC